MILNGSQIVFWYCQKALNLTKDAYDCTVSEAVPLPSDLVERWIWLPRASQEIPSHYTSKTLPLRQGKSWKFDWMIKDHLLSWTRTVLVLIPLVHQVTVCAHRHHMLLFLLLFLISFVCFFSSLF
jgi:hypothetical protein